MAGAVLGPGDTSVNTGFDSSSTGAERRRERSPLLGVKVLRPPARESRAGGDEVSLSQAEGGDSCRSDTGRGAGRREPGAREQGGGQ